MSIMSSFFEFFYGTIKRKLITNVIFIHTVLMGLVVYDLVEKQSTFMEDQLSNKGKELSSILALNAATPLLNNDLIALDELLHGLKESKDIYMAFLIDKNGKVKASTNKSYFNLTFTDKQSLTLIQKANIAENKIAQKTHQGLIDSIHTIRVNTIPIGYTRIILNNQNLTDELHIITNKGLLYVLLAILIGALFSWLSIHKTTHNLNELAKAASSLSEQNFDIRLPVQSGNDEVAKVLHAFAIMTASIKKYIAELVARENKSKWQANHDMLTGLFNRLAFEEQIKKYIKHADETDTRHVLLFLDLDKFKVINDSVGHIAGDNLLQQVSSLLSSCLNEKDFLARFGGDEFGIILKNCQLSDAEIKVQAIIENIEKFTFIWDDKRFKIGTCIGIVMIDGKIKNALELLSLADTACYIAKENGTNSVHVADFINEDFVKIRHEMDWISKIYDAINHNLFTLHIQKIESLKGVDDHYEVLIRMKNETGDIFPPDSFLPAATRYSLMPKIDLWVIETLFKCISVNPPLRNIHFAINLSGQSIMKDDFEHQVEALFFKYNIKGDKIIFEITETSAMSNFIRVRNFIDHFNTLGCKFSLDDFGTGASSFAYLKNFRVNFLKIDGSFVRDILDDPIDRVMVGSIYQIANLLGLQTIAEYVENSEIYTIIEDIGIDFGQGYGIKKPFPLEDFLGTLKS